MSKYNVLEALNGKLQKLNIEKWLRVSAFLLFAFSILTLFASHFSELVASFNNFVHLTTLISLYLPRIVTYPLILLGLAEIIRLMKEKQNDTD